MKAFVESYSKQLEQCTFLGMFIMDGPFFFFFFLGGGGKEGTGNLKKKHRASASSRCLICFSLGGIKEQLNRLTV